VPIIFFEIDVYGYKINCINEYASFTARTKISLHSILSAYSESISSSSAIGLSHWSHSLPSLCGF